MEHNVSLITTIAVGFGLAFVLGFIAERVKIPALVGYLLAGIIIGPATPVYVADVQVATQLSEIGVMLLMFGVGLHFSLATTWGDSGDSFVLVQSHIAGAAMLVAATPDPVSVRQMIDTACRPNPGIEIVLRTHSESEAKLLRKQRLGTVFFGEEALAKGMAHHILSRYAPVAHAART